MLKQSGDLNNLFEAILSLENTEECRQFFRDLMTIPELKSMGERFAIVNLLNQKIPYRKISEITGSSTATITRISHWLHHGEGGYRLVLDRLKK
jgi:TrpR-related protein YerC/YecD